MTVINVLLASLTLACAYITVTQAAYYTQAPPPGRWGPWSKWCECTKRCHGKRWRTRACLPYGSRCAYGKSKQIENCSKNCPVNGGYGPYGAYGPCSKSCGGGYQTCYRKCNRPKPQYGGKSCKGPASKRRRCNVRKCPVNGGYGPYGAYGPCSKSCGGGYQTCYRKCNRPKPQYGGKSCQGPASKRRRCNVRKCPVNGGYGPYGAYGPCSKSCGGGYQTCYRKCNRPKPQYGGKPCKGPASKRRRCNVRKCPAYVGFERPLYKVNEKAGKVVIRIRRSGDLSRKIVARISLLPGGSAGKSDRGPVDRNVVFPAKVKVQSVVISIKNDKLVEKAEFFRIKLSGKSPAVSAIKFKNTKVIIIDNDVVRIGFPKPASRTLRENVKKFTVKVTRSGASTLKHSVSVRSVDGTATSKAPNADYVKVNPTKLSFGPKDSFKTVTVTIIDDKVDEKPNIEFFTLVLSRTNDKRVVIGTGKFTVRIKDNDVNGKWSPWGRWSKCTKSCKYGRQSRSRKCNNPAPTPGAKGCKGPSKQSRKCNQNKPCPVNGKWGPWGPYSKCSKSCKSGTQSRSRQCNKPKPAHGGKPCSGPKKQSRKCNQNKPCPVNGKWGPWGPYSKCSKSCKSGTQSRSRQCNKPKPAHGGKSCSGPKKQSRKCNQNKPCPVNGKWGPWGPYSKCSKSCKSGTQSRSRQCNKPKPAHGGKSCSGPKKQSRKCNQNKPCPVNGKWGPWGPYSKCSKSCKSGTQSRSRQCNKPKPAHGGKPCSGPKKQSRACNKNKPCPVKVGFARAVYRVNENAGKVVIQIRRSGDLSRKITARISLLPGGSAGNSDRGPVDRNVVFPAKVKVQSVDIDIKNDKLVENVEFFRIKLSGKSPAVFPVKFKITKVIIVDDDTVDGKWGPWGPYSKCSKPCGGGQQTRTRKCNKPAPSRGGKKCPGSAKMTKKCNTKCCKVNGGFGPWSKWSACVCMPSSYGPPTRKQKRTRKCNKPKPSCGGKKCHGKYVEIKPCGNAYLPPCSAYAPYGK